MKLLEPGSRVHLVPAGFREDLFHEGDADSREARSLLYVGKYSHAKGLPQLLDAFEMLSDACLHVAGDGSGEEAEALRARMRAMDRVVLHGQVDQARLGDLMRAAEVCVLPSFYEGVPLVLVEAAACGCKVVATALAGVVEQIAPVLGARLTPVACPPMDAIDTPAAQALPAFVERLARALEASLASDPAPVDVSVFGWRGVFERVEKLSSTLIAPQAHQSGGNS